MDKPFLGHCSLLCETLGYRGVVGVGPDNPWAFPVTQAILFKAVHLCPLSECLHSPCYGQALWGTEGHRQDQRGYSLYHQGSSQGHLQVLPCCLSEPLGSVTEAGSQEMRAQGLEEWLKCRVPA